MQSSSIGTAQTGVRGDPVRAIASTFALVAIVVGLVAALTFLRTPTVPATVDPDVSKALIQVRADERAHWEAVETQRLVQQALIEHRKGERELPYQPGYVGDLGYGRGGDEALPRIGGK
jgi:hypothetical protein